MQAQAKRSQTEPVDVDHPPIQQEDIEKEKRLRKRAQKQLDGVQKKLENSRQLVLGQNKQIRELEKEKVKLSKIVFIHSKKCLV